MYPLHSDAVIILKKLKVYYTMPVSREFRTYFHKKTKLLRRSLAKY